MFLTDKALIACQTAIVVEKSPLHLVIQLEEAMFPTQVLFRILIPDQFGHVIALSREYKFVHLASLVALMADTVELAEVTSLLENFLLSN